ncbi:spore germination protein [Bacillus sp. V3B]|uniref:spore germination protein n=1 Tax=Bacillus sp. V3B TaxID=2804915 RepID=UPI00210BF227|nr:spore germination protein [Bacillus sp. V3B]MCQ6277482.1 spore germination protein [Bacillus sp. V3B]
MPALIERVFIGNVAGGTVQFGDILNQSPKSNSKSVNGSGSGNTGGVIITNNGLSSNNVLDGNAVDQPTVGNN